MGAAGAYRETSHTYINGTIRVAHASALATHNPSIEPVHTVEFRAYFNHLTKDPVTNTTVVVEPAVLQGAGYYGAQGQSVINSGVWINYAWVGLTAAKFTLLAGTGPLHPDFKSSGAPLQWGYITLNSIVSPGPFTKVVGVDSWIVKAHLAAPCSGTLGILVCFGDDITNPCPCFPSFAPGVSGHGCPNSLEARDAKLIGTGTASLANDTAILHGSLMPNPFCLCFQGTLVTGNPFGDGRLCVGGTIVRLAVKSNICTASQYPAGSEPSLSVQGLVTTPG